MIYYGWDKRQGWFYPTIERALNNRPEKKETLYQVVVKDGKIVESEEVAHE